MSTLISADNAAVPVSVAAENAAASIRRERVYEELSRAILNHEFAPGQRLIERELIEQYGVSRATIREALRGLAAAGLATMRPQQGARVATATPDDARDLYALRSAVESLVVERFIQHADASQVERLVDAVRGLGDVARSGAVAQEIMAERDHFYAAIFAGAGTEILQKEAMSVQARVRVLCASSLSEEGRSEAAAYELQAVVDAIVARATHLLSSHLELAAAATLRTMGTATT
jgi:DNA-binding GntR family transcriptional regulator